MMKKRMKNPMKKLILVSLLLSPLVFADPAPVVSITPGSPPADTSTDAAPATPVSASPAMPLTLDQRVTVLERQLSAMNQIDLVNQVSQLEQQVQDLQGQVQVLSHSLQTVQTQTTSQYADLDQRLQKVTAAAVTPTPTATTSTTTSTTSTTLATPVTSTDTTDTKITEKNMYDAAYKNIREQKNAEGIASMKKYLEKYPDGKYAPNAHYWLGQLYILKGDDKSVKEAVFEFNTVIKKYPKSNEAKEASLKLGFAYLLQNKNTEAKDQFKKVVKDFPGTSVAQLAQARLAQLK